MVLDLLYTLQLKFTRVDAHIQHRQLLYNNEIKRIRKLLTASGRLRGAQNSL